MKRIDEYPLFIPIAILIIVIFIMGISRSCTNMQTADEWNNGECPKCDVKYELRGVSESLKYYACPNCGQEVMRY